MCRLVDRLVRDGLVERHPDPDDRRATRVRLTPGGRGAAAHVAGLRRSRSPFADLLDAEGATLAALLLDATSTACPRLGPRA